MPVTHCSLITTWCLLCVKTYSFIIPHLYKLSELHCPILVQVHLFDHVPDLEAWHVLPQSLHESADLTGSDVAIAVCIKLEGGRVRGRGSKEEGVGGGVREREWEGE